MSETSQPAPPDDYSCAACVECGAQRLLRDPGPPCSMESYTCDACGATTWMHVHYVDQAMPRARVLESRLERPVGQGAVRVYLLLKRILVNGKYTHFSLAHLEEQYLRGDTTWILGLFYEDEAARLEAELARVGLTAIFELRED